MLTHILAEDTPETPSIFGVELQKSIKYANVAISLQDANGGTFTYGYVPIVVAKCGVFLKEKGMKDLQPYCGWSISANSAPAQPPRLRAFSVSPALNDASKNYNGPSILPKDMERDLTGKATQSTTQRACSDDTSIPSQNQSSLGHTTTSFASP